MLINDLKLSSSEDSDGEQVCAAIIILSALDGFWMDGIEYFGGGNNLFANEGLVN